VYTANNPLSHFQSLKLGATEQRWAVQLAFEFTVHYRPGKNNGSADSLSRQYSDQHEEAGQQTRSTLDTCNATDSCELVTQQQIQSNSIQVYLNSAFHNTYCFKAALQKVHYRKVYGKIHLVNLLKLGPFRVDQWLTCQPDPTLRVVLSFWRPPNKAVGSHPGKGGLLYRCATAPHCESYI